MHIRAGVCIELYVIPFGLPGTVTPINPIPNCLPNMDHAPDGMGRVGLIDTPRSNHRWRTAMVHEPLAFRNGSECESSVSD